MIESLFGCSDKNPAGNKLLLNRDASAQYVRILEPKKSQNLAISLKAMNVKSEEFCEALMEGISHLTFMQSYAFLIVLIVAYVQIPNVNSSHLFYVILLLQHCVFRI